MMAKEKQAKTKAITRNSLDEARRRIKLLLLREAVAPHAHFVDAYDFKTSFTVVDRFGCQFRITITPEKGE
jgi:hypothetical protein